MIDVSTDTAAFDAARHAMVVSQLRTSAVNDPRVVAAMADVPRERFVPAAARAAAYGDRQLSLSSTRAMNPPLTTGRLIVAAEIAPTDRVLLVGAGTGYAAAVLAQLAASVVALEEDDALLDAARTAGAGTATFVQGPLANGWADGAPYDAIVIDGAVDHVPDAIVEQLTVNGRLATGLVDRGVTRLAIGRRTAGGFGLSDFADMECAVLPGFARPIGFRFAK